MIFIRFGEWKIPFRCFLFERAIFRSLSHLYLYVKWNEIKKKKRTHSSRYDGYVSWKLKFFVCYYAIIRVCEFSQLIRLKIIIVLIGFIRERKKCRWRFRNYFRSYKQHRTFHLTLDSPPLSGANNSERAFPPFFIFAFSVLFFFSIFCFRANGASNMYARCRLKYISRGVLAELTYQHYRGNISCSFGYFTFPKTLCQQTSCWIKINSIIQWAALCIIACARFITH